VIHGKFVTTKIPVPTEFLFPDPANSGFDRKFIMWFRRIPNIEYYLQ